MRDDEPYHYLLGIYWAYDNYGVKKLKKEIVKFKSYGMRVIQPPDSY